MSFDRIDKKFRPKEIKPECETCHSTLHIVNRGTSEYPRLLCDECTEIEISGMYMG